MTSEVMDVGRRVRTAGGEEVEKAAGWKRTCLRALRDGKSLYQKRTVSDGTGRLSAWRRSRRAWTWDVGGMFEGGKPARDVVRFCT